MMYLLIISMLLFFITSTWAIGRVGKMKDKTISQHIAKKRFVQIVFGINGTIATILASIVLFSSTLPRYNANVLSYILFAILMFFFVMAAVIPQIENTWRAKVHYVAAWGMCFIIPFAIFLSLFWKLSLITLIAGVIALIAIVALLGLFICWRNLRKNFLAFQSLYLSIFFIYLLILTI